MRKFEVCKGFENAGVNLPARSTSESAGYDVEAIEDTIIPSIWKVFIDNIKIIPQEMKMNVKLSLPEDVMFYDESDYTVTPAHLAFKDDAIAISKGTLVKTGIKAYCESDEYVGLHNRSSSYSKLGLMLANNSAVIDADYCGNDKNDGHILLNFINFGFSEIKIEKGQKIAQAIFYKYIKTDNDKKSNTVRRGGWGSTGG